MSVTAGNDVPDVFALPSSACRIATQPSDGSSPQSEHAPAWVSTPANVSGPPPATAAAVPAVSPTPPASPASG